METEPQQVDELKELVRQNIALTQENNQLLHGMRRSMRLNTVFRAFLWILFIGSTIYSVMYFWPFIMTFFDLLGGMQEIINQAQTTLQQFQGGGR